MVNRILNLFRKKPEIKAETVRIPWFRLDKHYHDMTRAEKREYKRWLRKHNMWDGAIVAENMEREMGRKIDDKW